MADFNFKEAVEDFKKLPAAAKIGIVGGIGLMAWWLVPRSEAVRTVNDVSSLGTLGEGYSSDGGGSDDSLYSSGGTGGSAPVTNSPTEYDDLTDRISTMISSMTDYKAIEAETVQNQSDFEAALDSLPSIYGDEKAGEVTAVNDIDQFNKIVKSVTASKNSGTFSSSQAAQAISKIAGTGNNGIGWKEGDNAKISESLKDASNRASEAIRIKEVIKNREAAGLDTKLQRDHAERFGFDL